MKTFLLLLTAAALAVGEMSVFAQGTTGAGTGATGSTTGSTAPTSGPRNVGFAVQDGVVYLVQRGRVTAVTESMLPKGQIMIATGLLAPDGAIDRGFTMENGVVYRVEGAVRERVDAGLIPGGQMMTLDGVIRPLPVGITAFPGVKVIVTPGTGPVPATSEPR